jgi:hypothetical protein
MSKISNADDYKENKAFEFHALDSVDSLDVFGFLGSVRKSTSAAKGRSFAERRNIKEDRKTPQSMAPSPVRSRRKVRRDALHSRSVVTRAATTELPIRIHLSGARSAAGSPVLVRLLPGGLPEAAHLLMPHATRDGVVPSGMVLALALAGARGSQSRSARDALCAVVGKIVVAGAGTTTPGFAGAVGGLATAIAATRSAAGLVVVAEWLAGAAGGLAATTAVEGGLVSVARAARGLAGAVGGLAVAATGSARCLVAVAEAAAHHVHASELGAHVLGRVGVSLGGPERAASTPVILGVRDYELISLVVWIWIEDVATRLEGNGILTGFGITGWLLALRLGGET